MLAFIASFLALLPLNAEELWKTLPKPQPLPPATESGDAPINGITVHYAIWGDGSPLILLHGEGSGDRSASG